MRSSKYPFSPPVWFGGVLALSLVLFGTAFLMSFDVSASRLDTGQERLHAAQQSIGINVPLATATPSERHDFAPLAAINLGNFVWNDLNKNGRQDTGEPGISGVSVQLWNGAKNNLFNSAVTDTSGNYSLTAPEPGAYRIRALLPDATNDQFSPKNKTGENDNKDSDVNPGGTHFGFTAVIELGPKVTTINNIDIGIIKYIPPPPTATPQPIHIGNFVWHDLDADGRQDAGESGISGVTVQLWNAAKDNLLDGAVTNVSGKYKLSAPHPGSYRVRVLLPSGTVFTVKNRGSAAEDSDINPGGPHVGFTAAFTIDSGVASVMNMDAGLINAEAVFSP